MIGNYKKEYCKNTPKYIKVNNNRLTSTLMELYMYNSFRMDFAVGGLAGVGAGFFSNPFDVVKTRMQLQGELRAKGQHAVHYRNIPHAMLTIVKHDGVSALQKGLVPALWFQLVVNGVR